MSGLRFKVGDMALVAVAMNPKNLGDVVQILAIGPYRIGDVVIGPHGGPVLLRTSADYFVDGRSICQTAFDWQLRKLDPPAEPASLTRTKECEVTA
jgi:hypothetical protein